MTDTKKPAEDLNGAIDAIERRVAHLSALVYPEPGKAPHRSAHWRDEVELKALRIGVRCIKTERDRAGTPEGVKEATLLNGLTEAVDLLERIVESRRLSPEAMDAAQKLVDRLDEVIEAAE